ncbi:MAG: DUF3124 domain-containing protein [Desulfobulbaceae bacterium]|nr:DUF3124 domain-containing protein [Desulfobulbaceae bacterium]
MRKIITIFIFTFLFALPAFSAENKTELSSGQTVYVAIYSNVFSGPKERPQNLAAMLSIRNTDLHNQLTVSSAEYFNNNGEVLKEYAKKPIIFAPLASHHFSIQERDTSGGFGANFIIKWKSTKKINPPIIESVMIGAGRGQGISFVSQGKVIDENTK